MALGEAYDNLGRNEEAKRCYWKARSIGDVEGLALIKLARYNNHDITSACGVCVFVHVCLCVCVCDLELSNVL